MSLSPVQCARGSMVEAINLQNTPNITATCHLTQINALSTVQFSTFTPANTVRVPMTGIRTPSHPGCISDLCGARCTNAQRYFFPDHRRQVSRHCCESWAGMQFLGFKASRSLTSVCGHRESHLRHALSLAENKLPLVFSWCWVIPAPPWVFKVEILP